MKKSMISVVLVLAIALSLCTNVFAAAWESEIDAVGVAMVNDEYYDTLQDAVDNANGNIVTLVQNTTDAVTTTAELHLDLNGFEANVTAAKIYAYDSSATTEAAGKGKLVTNSTVVTLTQNREHRYVALEESENTYTVHAFKLHQTDVNLRTEQESGINYTAILDCDEVLKTAVHSYGVVLSLQDMPDANFEKASTDAYTVFAGAPAGEFQSGYVYNIFKDELKDDVNTKRGEYKIYANAYLRLKDNTIVMADAGTSWSLKDVMEELNENFADYAAQKTEIVNFYTTWQGAMAKWNLTNLAAK